MKGRAFIDLLRASVTNAIVDRDEANLLADAVEIADEECRNLIDCECLPVTKGLSELWMDTSSAINGFGGDSTTYLRDEIARALSYLDRRGLIERKEGELHLVRFVEET